MASADPEPPPVVWRQCPGRAVLLDDLRLGILSLDAIDTNAEEAWEIYGPREEFADVPFSQFKRQLKAHRDQVQKQRRRNGEISRMVVPNDDDVDVDWLRCAAREIMLEDLRTGRLSLNEEETTAEQAWQFYRSLHEFELVPFKQFKRQLKAHRAQVSKLVAISWPQEQALENDRLLHPVRTTNQNGKPLFYLTEAATVLREDIKDDVHAGMTPSQFRRTRRVYRECGLSMKEFKQRIYQEIRYRKYVNYLNQERERLLTQVAEKRVKGGKRKRKKKTTTATMEPDQSKRKK